MLADCNPMMLMLSMLFILGMFAFLAGVVILVVSASGKEVKALNDQAARLVQKGVAETMAGLLGNLANLLDSMDQLVRTARGIGVFLTIWGGLIMVGAAWLTTYVPK
ncbi:MAG: hypothetical protein JXA78_10255 [Anaerolineales bacterium]|nr:hypothetical protein [Anaerolineales bacterium]